VSNAIEPICVERILVSLDSSPHSFAALRAAIELAHHYDAALKGVFVEDLTLLSLAEMPFRQEVGEYSAILREISAEGISHGILVQSRWVIRTFQKLINQTDLSGVIAVLRGKVSETIDNESEECDLLILGKSGTNPILKHRLGSTTRALVRRQRKSLLLVEEENHLGYPMIVLYKDSQLGWKALETARDIMDPGETLIVLLNNEDPEAYTQDRQKVADWASTKQINISVQHYKPPSLERFVQQIHGLKTGLFILPHIQTTPDRRLVDLVLEKVSLPILLIRTENST
jgi:nucleotide-binding universal stress UspA family protein